MSKRFGYIAFGGMMIGIILGWIGSGGTLGGVGIGALAGTALGWFAAAADMERSQRKL